MEFEKPDFSRVSEMTDAELVRWRFMCEHMLRIEEGLAFVEQSFRPGRRQPDPELVTMRDAIVAELAKRSAAKSVD